MTIPHPPPGDLLREALQELAGLLLSTDSFQVLMQRIADLAVRAVPGTLTCGITMANAGRVFTVASADRLASLLEEQQYDIDEGPCLESLRTGQIVNASDLSFETRWGGYPQRAVALGVSAVFASPLTVRNKTLGALNLYADTAGTFDSPGQQDLVAQIVLLSGVAITGTLRNYGDVTLTDQLQTALDSRSIIDQAVGIVMATQRCTADQAFSMLRGISQNRNIRLAVIARDLVDRTATADPA